MNPDVVLRIAKEMIEITLILSLHIMGVGLVVGLFISLLQSLTQMHEMTLTFVPKIIAVAVVMVLTLPWMMDLMISFTVNLFQQIPGLGR